MDAGDYYREAYEKAARLTVELAAAEEEHRLALATPGSRAEFRARLYKKVQQLKKDLQSARYVGD